MTTERDRVGEAIALTTDVVDGLTRVTVHAYRNLLKLGRIPLELAYDEDEQLGVRRTTVFVPAPADADGRALHLRCRSLIRVRDGKVVDVTPTLDPSQFPPSTLPCWVSVEVPRQLPGGLYELELNLRPEVGGPSIPHTYLLYFGRPRAAG